MACTNRLTCVALLAIALFLPLKSWGQNSVGINTDNPNPNAVLELVSPTNNQGFLIPRLTTAQRLGMQLGETENGLLVFDDEEGIFYYWKNNAWQPLPGVKQPQTLALTGKTLSLSEGNEVDLTAIDSDDQGLTFTGTTLEIEGGNTVDLANLVDDADADPENEIQDLALTGNNLTVTGNAVATPIDLSPYLDNTDGQILTLAGTALEISGGNSADLSSLVDDADADPANELQNISTDNSAGNISLSSGSTITLNVNDADADPGNEIQDLALTGNNLAVTNNAAATAVDLSPYLDNTDGQTLTLTNTTLEISGGNAADLSTLVDDADADPGNEYNTTVGLTGTTLDVTDPGGTLSVDLNPTFTTDAELAAWPIDDADADATNEYNTAVGLTRTSLNVTDLGGTLSVDLDPTFTTDAELAAWPIDDADADPANEIQSLSLSANTLALTRDAATVNLAPYQQTISKSGNTVSLSNTGGSFTFSSVPANSGQFLSWNGSNWIAADADPSSNNELQNLSFNSPILSLSGSTATVDLSSIGVPPQDPTVGGYFLSTNGNIASWEALGMLAKKSEVTTTEIFDGTITGNDLDPLIAGPGLTGGGGPALSVSLADTSGLEFNSSGQLIMPYLIPPGTYGSSSETIQSITLDAKGRVVGLTTKETATGTLTSIVSDQRLKKQINSLSNSMEKVLQLGGYTYYMKSDSLSKDLQIGVMAQELEKVYPNLVIQRPDGYKAVNYVGLIPVLLEALKEEHQRVSALEAKLLEMESKMAAGDQRMNSLEEKLNLLIQASTASKTSPTQE